MLFRSKRGFIGERYGVLVDALYDDARTHQFVETEMKFEDGRRGVVAADLQIVDAKTFPVMRKAA